MQEIFSADFWRLPEASRITWYSPGGGVWKQAPAASPVILEQARITPEEFESLLLDRHTRGV